MSTQEDKLKAIADAIREKEGSADPIPAGDFPERIRAIQSGGVQLSSIAITAPPNKVSYATGDLFDPAGMVVTATYSNGATLIATGWAVEPAGPLPEGLTVATIRYTEGGVSVTVNQPISVSSYWLFGFDINNADSNPATRVSYPGDVHNARFAAAKMDFDTDTFSYGGWPSTPGEKFMPQPCMLNFDGTVAYYLDPNDYTKKADGTASDVADVNFGGNAMMEWPKIFTKRWETDGVYHFRCSDQKLDEDYECWCNYDKNDQEILYFYTHIFPGFLDDSSRLRSISGQKGATSKTAGAFGTYAGVNGADIWYIEVLADRLLIQDLLVMMFKSTNIKACTGLGTSNYNVIAGTLNTKGMFWGVNAQTDGVKVFGMEHWWGGLSRYLAGWHYSSNGTQCCKITWGTKDGTSGNKYYDNYILIPDSTINYSSASGYVAAMKTMPYGRFPISIKGSSSTYETDSMGFQPVNGPYYAVAGGYAHSVGPFSVSLNIRLSATSGYTGAALSCKPLASAQAQS